MSHAAMFSLLAQTTQPVIQLPPVVLGTDWHKTLADLANTLLTALSAVVAYYLVPWLKSRVKQADAQSDNVQAQTKLTQEQSRSLIADRVKRWVAGNADMMADKYFPIIASAIVRGQLTTVPGVKDQLHALGRQLKEDAIKQFREQGLDLIEALGTTYVDGLIARAAVAVSPFPGKDTARALLAGGAKDILSHGMYYVRTLNTVSPAGAPPLPPAAAAALAVTSAPAVSAMQINSPLVNVASSRPVSQPAPVPGGTISAGPPGASIDEEPIPAQPVVQPPKRRMVIGTTIQHTPTVEQPLPHVNGNGGGFVFAPTATLAPVSSPQPVEPQPAPVQEKPVVDLAELEDPNDTGVFPVIPTPVVLPKSVGQPKPLLVQPPHKTPAIVKPVVRVVASPSKKSPPPAKGQGPAHK